MVQGYSQESGRSDCGWASTGTGFKGAGLRFIAGSRNSEVRSHLGGFAIEQWSSHHEKESKLSGSRPIDREVGGSMLSVTGLNHFYYVRDFSDMRCKHNRVLSIIREQLHREPNDGDVFIVMSKNRRIVRLFSYDHRSYSLFEKKFVSGYQFMKVEKKGDETVYRINWKDVVLLLENPIVKTLKIR